MKHSGQIFDWLRALITIIFSQPNKSIRTQDSQNKITSQLELGPFSPFQRVFTTLSTKNIACIYKANFHLIFCLVQHHALLINLYWRHCAIAKGWTNILCYRLQKFYVFNGVLLMGIDVQIYWTKVCLSRFILDIRNLYPY